MQWWIKKDKAKKDTSRFQRFESNRDRNQKFYVSDSWRRLRLIKISLASGLCELCQQKGLIVEGTEVHHIQPINLYWSERFNLDNLLLLCKPCHSIETVKEQTEYRNAERENYMNDLNDF